MLHTWSFSFCTLIFLDLRYNLCSVRFLTNKDAKLSRPFLIILSSLCELSQVILTIPTYVGWRAFFGAHVKNEEKVKRKRPI